MFLVFFIQAYIALTGVLTSFIGSSLNLFSQSAFDLILDIPTVAYFFSTVHNSTDANTPVVASTGNEYTTDICTWGIPGLLALRPVALPPSIINVPSREIQLYHAHSLALSLIMRDPASCPFLGPQITDDLTTESSTEPILKTSTEMNIITTSLPASNDDLSNDPHATAALVLRLIFISGLCSIGMLGTVMIVEIARQRIQDKIDSCESTGYKMVDVDSESMDSPAKDALEQTINITIKRKRNTKAQRRAKQKARREAEDKAAAEALFVEAYRLAKAEAESIVSEARQETSSHRRLHSL